MRFSVVPPSSLLDAVVSRRAGDPFPLAITFDDDLRSHVEVAAPILRGLGLPAGFFLNGMSLAAPYEFWWERLQRAFDMGQRPRALAGAAPGASSIREVAAWVEDLEPWQRRDFADRLAEEVGPPPERSGLRAQAVRELRRDGFEIGFHTLHHDPLVSLDDEALRGALTDGRDELAAVAGPLSMIAYPHGRADRRVADAARNAGYRVGFTTSWEAVSAADDPLLLGRVDPSFESASHLALRLSRRLAVAAGARSR
ncbi:MAG: polysaccharide deacetylase family protein [Acidimicrobiia bacterium]